MYVGLSAVRAQNESGSGFIYAFSNLPPGSGEQPFSLEPFFALLMTLQNRTLKNVTEPACAPPSTPFSDGGLVYGKKMSYPAEVPSRIPEFVSRAHEGARGKLAPFRVGRSSVENPPKGTRGGLLDESEKERVSRAPCGTTHSLSDVSAEALGCILCGPSVWTV